MFKIERRTNHPEAHHPPTHRQFLLLDDDAKNASYPLLHFTVAPATQPTSLIERDDLEIDFNTQGGQNDLNKLKDIDTKDTANDMCQSLGKHTLM